MCRRGEVITGNACHDCVNSKSVHPTRVKEGKGGGGGGGGGGGKGGGGGGGVEGRGGDACTVCKEAAYL